MSKLEDKMNDIKYKHKGEINNVKKEYKYKLSKCM